MMDKAQLMAAALKGKVKHPVVPKAKKKKKHPVASPNPNGKPGKKTPHMKPKGKRGKAAVKRLGRDYKTGNFDKIAAKAGGGEKGKRIAGAIYWDKVKHGGQGHA